MDQPAAGGGTGGHGSDEVRVGWIKGNRHYVGPMPDPTPIPRKHDRCIIICGGTDPTTLPGQENSALPDDRQQWEVWGLNAIRPKWTEEAEIKWDRWFNLHRYPHLLRDWNAGVDIECAWSQANPEIPFYVLDDWAGRIANPRLFPRRMGFPRDDYHACSIDMFIAFALHLGMTEISLHGVDMINPHVEPISARACIEYWIGFAEARGVKVHVSPECDLLVQWFLIRSNEIYGWDDVHIIRQLNRTPDPA